MNKEDTKQAILGFTEFFKGITGNQDLKIPDDIAKKYEIEQSKWIPVNQPPKASGRYIVSMRHVTYDVVETASYSTDLHEVDEYDFPKHEAGWYNYDSEYGYYKIENVIVAYMPLPEPYKASPTGAESEEV
jgi:hypothetical protein